MGGDETTRLETSAALPNHMAGLAKETATGVLAAATDRARREILFVNGEIRAARSSSEEEKLGMWLVDRGKISEDDRDGGLEDDLLATYNDGSACLVMTTAGAGALAVINADLAAR